MGDPLHPDDPVNRAKYGESVFYTVPASATVPSFPTFAAEVYLFPTVHAAQTFAYLLTADLANRSALCAGVAPCRSDPTHSLGALVSPVGAGEDRRDVRQGTFLNTRPSQGDYP